MMGRVVCLSVAFSVGATSYGCATGGSIGGVDNTPQTKIGTIATYLDADNKCRTSTTPYVGKAKRGRDKIRWKIVDEVNCTDDSKPVRIDFTPTGKGPNPFAAGCDLSDDKKIECPVRSDAPAQLIKYSVWLGDSQEDPEIEIVM